MSKLRRRHFAWVYRNKALRKPIYARLTGFITWDYLTSNIHYVRRVYRKKTDEEIKEDLITVIKQESKFSGKYKYCCGRSCTICNNGFNKELIINKQKKRQKREVDLEISEYMEERASIDVLFNA